MEPLHPLKALLQLQLATDASSALHLPYVLASICPQHFSPSPHLQKWTTRINSLLYSKDPAGRWAGLCIAYQTSTLSRSVMIDCAHSWMGVALPSLSKNEPLPTLKAAIRLLRYILVSATDVPEFQRQVATPNVLKFSQALVALSEKREDPDLKLLVLTTLGRIVPLYPTLHRPLNTSLNALCMRYLNGTVSRPTSSSVLEAASPLYSILHLIGGKVGALNLWRKSIDETLAFSWSAFEQVTTTVPHEGRKIIISQPLQSPEEPALAISLNIDRLRCGVTILSDLLMSTSSRPVQVPIGLLVNLITGFLSCTPDEQVDGHVDPTVRAMEVSVIPEILKLGCTLLESLSKCVRNHLSPHVPRLTTYIVYHLEQKLTTPQRLPFLHATTALLAHSYPLHSALPPTRLAKAILPSITVILAPNSKPSDTAESGPGAGASQSSKKGKKRARGYEGDEVFKTAREVICRTADDGDVILAALDALQIVLQNPQLAPAVHSISSRVLLSALLALQQMSPAALSADLTLYGRLLCKVQQLTSELASGTSSVMSKSLGLVIRASGADSANQRETELLLHPRLPPLVRPMPHVESLSLFRGEESQEEADVRQSLGLATSAFTAELGTEVAAEPEAQAKDTIMGDPAPQPAPSPKISAVVEPKLTFALQSTTKLPPPPDPLSSSSAASAPLPASIPSVPAVQRPVAVPVEEEEEEEEEDMPTIDMDSDSD